MYTSLPHSDSRELDLLNERPFMNNEILASYEAVVDGLAMLISEHYEIVLHSLEDLKCSAVRIANGEHTGRKVGSPISALALRMLHDMAGEDSSVSRTYFTLAKNDVLMKSVTIAIRNREQCMIGLLCINMNLDALFSQIMQTLISPKMQDIAISVNVVSSLDDLVAQALEFTIEEVSADHNVYNNAKNRQIALNLHKKASLTSRIPSIRSSIGPISPRTRCICISVSLKVAIL
ncbi:MAG: hypothetical protein GPOALKHO_001146 [Sodalis sp.]|nr:MAG: hypothetical protein GPOALKHO_001146 [Sodalis sp.]